MKYVVAGTAGHIDHGKTALVRALTGVDTDRFEEEKRRGISIDIGFAHLPVSENLLIALIDVPGHERFIKNMLAGTGGVDFVLLVVAADESLKAQTREHFDICRLLRVKTGLVVITKCDLVDPEIVELVKLEIEEYVAGSFLEGAPIVPVSVVTGAGLTELRGRLEHVALGVGEKQQSAYFRLPIDRSFAMRGFGSVVTGTVTAGSIEAEDDVEAYPTGRICRVRGIQVHGESTNRAVAGQRAALNLAGAHYTDLQRGMWLAAPGIFNSSRFVDTRFELLSSAKPLKNRAPVHFHAGTAEIEAEARTLESDTVEPGASAYVRFVLREPALLVPGDRFVVRMFSPVVTIGGGEVLDIAAPRKRTDAAQRLSVLENGNVETRMALLVRESRFGRSVTELAGLTGVHANSIAELRPEALTYFAAPHPWFVDANWLQVKLGELRQTVAEFHRANALLPGYAREELRSRRMADAPAFLFDAMLAADRELVAEGDLVRLRSHTLSLRSEEHDALLRIERAFEAAGLSAPAVAVTLATSGVEHGKARTLLQMLLRQRRLVRITEDLVVHPSALRTLRDSLAERRGQRFSVGEFKAWTAVSRKYAIPLLEYLDRERVTRREGEARVVL